MNLQYCETCNQNIIARCAELHGEVCILKHRKKPPPIPDDIQEIKSLLKRVLKDYDMLKDEVENLKKNQTIQKRKRISDILNERECHIGIYEWMKQIVILDEDIDRVLNSNIVMGMKYILENLCGNENTAEDKMTMPIAAFIQKENKLYLYDNTKWRMATKKDIMKIIVDSLRSKFIIAFNQWPEEQLKKYGKPGYKLFPIIDGSKFKDNDITNEIYKTLFAIFKINLEKDTIDDLDE